MTFSSSISVVIPAYNEESTITAVLVSLTQQIVNKPFEVIVVNNASTDSTREVAVQFSDRLLLRVIDEPQKSRGAARATGFAAARGSVIFSTDADATLPPNWIENVSAHFTDSNVVAVSGIGKISDLSFLQNSVFNIIQPLATFIFGFFYGARWLTGFNFAIRKEAYRKAGGFNRTLNAQEDVELGFAVQKVGKIKMIWSPRVTVSGRRFKTNGIIKGLWQYVESFNQYQNDPSSAVLDDPR